MIGQEISKILSEIECSLWEYEANNGIKPNYTKDGFRAATKIFMSVIMDKMFELQTNEKIPMEYRIKMVKKAGEDVRNLIKTYTDIDTYELY